jgi:hypothetical protein
MSRNLRMAAFWWWVSIALAAGLGFEYGRKVERNLFVRPMISHGPNCYHQGDSYGVWVCYEK